jgi:hypothetical protein
MAQSVLVSILDTNNLSLSAAAKAPSRDERPGPEATKAQRQAEVKERETLMAELRARIKGFQKQAEDKISPPQCKAAGNLLLRCDELEREIVRQFAPGGLTGAVAVRYCSFLVTDSYLFPMQRMARINSFEEIQTVRISPIDARRAYSAQPLDAKLCGNSLANFSGFLKRSWRANDTMWGRLDGVCQLIECLVTHDRVKKVGKRSIDVSRLRVMFPHASQADLQQISDLTSRIGTLLEPEFQNLLDSLVRAAQAEILEEEVPRVIDAAIRQHADWNEFPLAKQDAPLMSVRQVWRISPKRLDTAVTGYASGQLSINMVPPGGWTHYFEDIYRVGLETWKDGVPPTILGEIVTQAALVMANCLMGTVGSNASKIRGYRIYRALHVPAQLAYRAMRIQRTAPEFSWSIYVALALSAGLLILDIPFIRKILFGAQSSSPNWELWAIPAVIAALTLTWIGIRVYLARAQRPVAQPDRGILQALSRITELPDAETDSLVLNRYSWNHHAPQPGAVIDPAGRISNPVPGPPLAYTGPVQTFCARETANRELREALAKEVFAGLPVNTNWMEIQVEQLSVQQPATKLEHWLLQNKELANLNSPGKSVTVVRQVYAGKLVVTTRLARAKPKFDKDELNAKLNARGFRIRSTETDDPSKEIRIVSLQPVVFAYLAGEASLQLDDKGEDKQEKVNINPLGGQSLMRRVWSSVPWPRRDDAPKPGTGPRKKVRT